MDILGKTQVFTRGSRQDLVVSRGTIVFTTGVGGMSLCPEGVAVHGVVSSMAMGGYPPQCPLRKLAWPGEREDFA